ncbi:MAG: transglycosylase domain-containing protein, partial [Chloroflexota bacterium]
IQQGASLEQDVDESIAEDDALEGLSPAEEAAVSGQDYIQQQIAALQGDAPADDPLSYSTGQEPVANTSFYEQQIAALGGDPAGDGQTGATGFTQFDDDLPSTQAMPVDPEQEALAQKFLETERQVRELRQQRDSGLLNPQAYESALRELLVLDNDNNWWMMGADTEIWYRYDQNAAEWVVADPPRPASATGAPSYQGVPTDTGNLDPNEVIRGSMPLAGEGYTAPDNPFDTAGQTPDDSGYMPPGQVPTGPDVTMVGASAYADELSTSAPTVANPAVTFDDDDGYAAPDSADPIYGGDAEAFAADEEYTDETSGIVDRARARQQRSLVATVGVVAALVFIGTLLIASLAIGFVYFQYQNIATRWENEIATLDLFESSQVNFQDVFIYAANGDEIARLVSPTGGNRVRVDYNDISPMMIHATVSSENDRFFDDPGFDLIAIARAFIQNLTGQEVVSGASTITQQLTRQLVFDETEFQDDGDRKLNEIVVAAEISRLYSKEEILEAYLNNIFFGNNQFGVEAAAEFYFDKDAADLNLAEAAMIAGLIPRPAEFDPVTNKDAAIERMRAVSILMADNGCVPVPPNGELLCISRETLRGEPATQFAQIELTTFEPRSNEFIYPHFSVFVQERLQQNFTQDEIFRRGFRVYTTLNPRIQGVAESALADGIEGLTLNNVQTGTVMVTDPRTGAIRAMVGSPDFDNETINGQINYALTYQQPGSAVKPLTYAAALSAVPKAAGTPEWYTPATILWDVPTTYEDGTLIQNFDGRTRGPVTVRNALQQSLNIPAVKAYVYVGNQSFQQVTESMGIRYQDSSVLTPATGVGATEVRLFDMMEAYGTISNGGQLAPLFAIERIEDFNGNPVEFARAEPTEGISAQTAYLMQDILSDDAARIPQFGQNNNLGRGYPQDTVGAKTGTSNNASDLWTMGFTSNAVVGVWMGTVEQNAATTGNLTGSSVASPVWRRVMDEVIAASPPTAFTPPQGVVQQRYCTVTGTQIADNVACPGAVGLDVFISNQPPPPATEGFVRSVQIDTWTGLLFDQNICPNDPATIQAANISDPTAISWLNNVPAGRQYAQSIGLSLPIVRAPEQTCGSSSALLNASITAPTSGQQLTTPQVLVSGIINAGGNLQSYDLQVANANAPDSFQIVAGPFQGAPTSQSLGTWDATGFANGNYILRVAMNSTTGGFAYRTVPITLQLPLPTATPTPPPLPTAPPIVIPTDNSFGATPIPFDQATPIPFEAQGSTGDTQQDFSP